MESSPSIIWAVVRLWYTHALVLWESTKYEENKLADEQLSTAFQVIVFDRKEGLGMAQALFTELNGLPEEMYLLRKSYVPHEAAPDYPAVFQGMLQLRAKAKEDGQWVEANLPTHQRDRLAEIDRYIQRCG